MYVCMYVCMYTICMYHTCINMHALQKHVIPSKPIIIHLQGASAGPSLMAVSGVHLYTAEATQHPVEEGVRQDFNILDPEVRGFLFISIAYQQACS